MKNNFHFYCILQMFMLTNYQKRRRTRKNIKNKCIRKNVFPKKSNKTYNFSMIYYKDMVERWKANDICIFRPNLGLTLSLF